MSTTTSFATTAVTTYKLPLLSVWAASLLSLSYLHRRQRWKHRNENKRRPSLAVPVLTRAPSSRVAQLPSPIKFTDDVLNEAYTLMLGGGAHSVYLVRTSDECDLLINKILADEHNEDIRNGTTNSIRVIGFDCEWRPGDKQKKKEAKKDKAERRTEGKEPLALTDTKEEKASKSESKDESKSIINKHTLIDEASARKRSAVAMLQLSFRRCTVLVHLAVIGFIPNSLLSILDNPNIYKTGVGCTEDATYLYRDYGVHVKGTVELAPLALRTSLPQGGVSLRALANDVLSVQLDKDFRIRCGNWDEADLSHSQLIYAAADAFYSREIFMGLYNLVAAPTAQIPVVRGSNVLPQLFEPASPPPPPTTKKPVATLQWSDVPKWCEGLVDIKAPKPASIRQKGKANGSESSKPKKDKLGFATRASPLYQNCVMLSPDGTFLCTCDQWKIQWYLDRQLGTIVKSEPLTIQLNFKPAGAGNAGSKFYEEAKNNQCVVCGETNTLLRHNVIPHLYRRHFPVRIKSHSSHDVVLLCARCHQRADMENDKLRRQLLNEIGSTSNNHVVRETIDNVLKPVVGAAAALLRNRDRLPVERREELLDVLRKYYSRQDISDIDIQQASEMKYRKVNADHEKDNNGALVVRQLCGTAEDLARFTRRWRQWFLDSMKPQYLSKHWDVNHTKPNDDFISSFNKGDVEEAKRASSSSSFGVECKDITVDVIMTRSGVRVHGSEFAGTRGQSRPIEGFGLQLQGIAPSDLDVEYMVHAENDGDSEWKRSGTFLQSSKSRRGRIAGIAVRLVGARAHEYNVCYMAHLANSGDTRTFANGEYCGTRAKIRAVEGTRVWITLAPPKSSTSSAAAASPAVTSEAAAGRSSSPASSSPPSSSPSPTPRTPRDDDEDDEDEDASPAVSHLNGNGNGVVDDEDDDNDDNLNDDEFVTASLPALPDPTDN